MRRVVRALMLGAVLVATRAAAAPLAEPGAPAAAERGPVRALRGLGALESGYPLLRWPRRLAPAVFDTRDERSGLWLRLGHDADRDDAAPGGGRRLRAGASRVGAPFPFLPLAGGEDLFGQLWVRLGTRAGLRAEYHVLTLGDPRSPWLGAGGSRLSLGEPATPRSDPAHILGVGFALALSDRIGVDAQYGHAFGHALADPGLAGAAAHFGYVELTLRY